MRGRSDAVAAGRGFFMTADISKRARHLRERQTKAKSRLWNVLRAKRRCGLKFRRQHPVDPFITDFACISRRVIVEIDGGYHDYQYEDDLARQQYLENQGWSVMRFANEDVLDDVEDIAVSIANRLGLKARYGKRRPIVSGMKAERPSPAAETATSPASGRGVE